MATVYLATQESLDRPVSIKVMAREGLRDEISMQRFENEARTIAKLGHSGIVGIHEVGRTGDARCIRNAVISDAIWRNVTCARRTQITEVLLAADALGYATVTAIVPSRRKEESSFRLANRPQLTDFARPFPNADTSLDQGWIVGRRSGFMSPEQAAARPSTAPDL